MKCHKYWPSQQGSELLNMDFDFPDRYVAVRLYEVWVDKMTSLQDFRAGWFLDVLMLDSYLLSTQTSLGQKLSFQALPHAVGNVWIRLQNRWTFAEFYTLRKLSHVWSSVDPAQLSFADLLPWLFFCPLLQGSALKVLIPWLWAVAKDMGLLWTSDVRTLRVWCFSLVFHLSVRSLFFFLHWELLLFLRSPFWWQDIPKVSLWVNAGCRTQALPHRTEQCEAQPPPGSHRSP